MSFSAYKFKNLVRQEATPQQKDYWKNILPYGDNDDFPLRLARLVQNSPTASSCIDTKIDFIEGAGFSDANLAALQVNGQGQNFADIHSLNSQGQGMFSGFAMNIKYNRAGKISEIFNVPFEYCRFALPDTKGVINKIKVNPYYGTGQYWEKYTKIYDVFNPNQKDVLAQMQKGGSGWPGQILYYATTSPLSRFYPAPSYYSAGSWMYIDEAIGGFHSKNIQNGFFQSILMTLVGDENAPSKHPDDQTWDATTNQYIPDPQKTNGYRFAIEMQKFNGWENAGEMMALWATIKEAAPIIQAFPSNQNTELFKTIQDSATENIARATKVPAVLANIQSGASLGGDGNNIRASVKLMQQRVAKDQAAMERVYKSILLNMQKPFTGEVKILNYNPFPEMQVLDPLIWATLPMESKLAWIKKNTDFEIKDTAPTAPVNKFNNVSYTSYPASAKAAAQKALNFRNDTGSNCGGRAGWAMTQDIIDGKPINYKLIKRINSFLKKNQGHKNSVFSDSCESVLYSAWGGDDMLNWTDSIINSING